MDFFPIVTGLIGTIIGACLSFLAQNYILRRNDFLSAAKEFRASFAKEYAFLSRPVDEEVFDNDNIWVSNYIEDWMFKHEIAIMKFLFYISTCKRKAFKKAYYEYCYPNVSHSKERPRDDYYYKASEKPNVDAEIESRNLLVERIDNLFKFAKI